VIAAQVERPGVERFEHSSSEVQGLGQDLGNAFYRECSLADIMLASGLSAWQIVATGKSPIRSRRWLRKLTELNPGLRLSR
jgi:hypothetical protein